MLAVFILSFAGAFIGASAALYLLPRDNPLDKCHAPPPVSTDGPLWRKKGNAGVANIEIYANRRRTWLYGAKGDRGEK